MIINDKIYGNLEINTPIIIELINSKPFQRLKYISQQGLPDKYHHLDINTRYEHSLGVYMILNRLNASEIEQVAGLLHDISHTAFSHMVDWVIGEDHVNETYQDNRHLEILKQKNIADILHKYGYTPEQMADLHSFTLLDRDIPELCADRIDYSIREFPLDIAHKCLPSFINHNNEIMFNSKDIATLFAKNFLKRQTEHWGGYESATRYDIFSKLLREAIQNKDISIDDFSQTDDYIMEKILQTNNPKYISVLKVLENSDLSYLPKSERTVMKKFRYVNPNVLIDGKIERLSEIDSEFKKEIEKAREENTKGIKVGILS